KEVVAEEGAEMVTNAAGKLVQKPQYGGMLNLNYNNDPNQGWTMETMSNGKLLWYIHVAAAGTLLSKDRLTGPGGTGEWNGFYSASPPVNFMAGNLAESWEIIEPDTLIFHIRKGVHWQDKPPANGREMTAADVVYSFVGVWTFPAGYKASSAYLADMENLDKSIYISPDDPWAVVFKSAPGELKNVWDAVANRWFVMPKELGLEGFGTWQGLVTTGPFLLTDYVSGSSLTYQRNPNYWKKDPLHPENQLPYVDAVKLFIIVDPSTVHSALRTGKIDIVINITAEDSESLIKSNPELQRAGKWANGRGLYMRNDVAPFDDVRVRQAMTMAINYDEIVEEYYGGKAEKFWWPAFPIPEHVPMWKPIEEMPESVQELYGYHPDKAAKLLDEAGLSGPNRFTTSAAVSASESDDINLLTVIQEYWARIGVTLEIEIKEGGSFRGFQRRFAYEHGVYGAVSANQPARLPSVRASARENYARVNDPLIAETTQRISEAGFDWDEIIRINIEAAPEMIMKAYIIKAPLPMQYNMWRPWVKGFHGENDPQYLGFHSMSEYVWIDQDMKEEITGRRFIR
ncbi:ABC transporter substrate-binding protein, partial [Chloroflexota bacterium]